MIPKHTAQRIHTCGERSQSHKVKPEPFTPENKMQTKWVIIADSNRARIFQTEGNLDELVELEDGSAVCGLTERLRGASSPQRKSPARRDLLPMPGRTKPSAKGMT